MKSVVWRLLAYVCFLLPCLLAMQNGYAQNKDSLLHQLKLAKHDTQKIYILRSITALSDDTTIRRYFDDGIALCQKGIADGLKPQELYLAGLATIYGNMGSYYKHRSEYANALDVYKKAEELSDQLHDKRFKSIMLNDIAILYDDMGNMRQSLETSYKDLQLQEELNDSLGMAYTYNNIAHIFIELKDDKNALEYYTKSLKMFDVLKHKKGMAMIMCNMGTYYSSCGDGKTALIYYGKSLELYRQMKDTYSVGEVLSCCGFELDKQGQVDSALAYFNQALLIAKELNVKENMAYAYRAMAKIFLKKGNAPQAQEYALLSLQISKQLENLRDIQNAAKMLKEIYLQKGNYKDAYAMHDLEITIRDSTVNEANYKDAINKKLQYDFDKRELELTLGNEKKIWEKNVLIFASLLAALLVSVGSFFYTRHSKLKNRLETMELEQQQYRAQMNPHFIFNCLHSIQHYILHNDVISANKYLSEFASLMRTTMEHNQLQTIALQQEIDYLNSYLSLEQMRFENKFTYQINCSADVDISVLQVLPTIIQPFAENAIVHGLCYLENGGRLLVSFTKVDDRLVCTVDDNGIGRRASKQIKARSGKTHVSQGMELVKKRLALASSLHKTTFSAEVIDKTDADGKALGTLVILKFPLEL
ncbi:tetratricopeptide repeat-containing sensor histidine kinase [Flavipsychrobacter stenotrophus]|nr:tetratricopeptide repeat protein [Flavipsychrobacter stenotrophus]